MKTLDGVPDRELLALMEKLVLTERGAGADVIEHLMEIDRRRLYLGQACSSLSSYCIERLGYSEDEAVKRVRVARLAWRYTQVLEELRGGHVHLTGLSLLARHMTEENHVELLLEARGKSRRAIEALLAARFPKPDLPERIARKPEQVAAAALIEGDARGSGSDTPESGPGTGACSNANAVGRAAPLSASRWSIQFTATREFIEKLEHARALLSHSIPSGELSLLFERALDALLDRETKRRFGAGKPRKRRPLAPGSRHVPVEVARRVWERDEHRCTFVDEQGRRCSARRFLTIEHRDPFACGGPATEANLTLLCRAHNAESARRVFGESHLHARRAEKEIAQAVRVSAKRVLANQAPATEPAAARGVGRGSPRVHAENGAPSAIAPSDAPPSGRAEAIGPSPSDAPPSGRAEAIGPSDAPPSGRAEAIGPSPSDAPLSGRAEAIGPSDTPPSGRAEAIAPSDTPPSGRVASVGAFARVRGALHNLGFREAEIARALYVVSEMDVAREPEPLLRAAIAVLTSADVSRMSRR